jgi:ribosomal protein S27E
MDPARRAADTRVVSHPRVSCTSCGRTWNSVTMAEGLRSIGTCPRCGGTLAFAEPPAGGAPTGPRASAGPDVPPSQVLGVPRR